MKPTAILVLILVFLSGLSGYLLSKASLAGKTGISLFYKEYRFLKVWWQAALVIIIVYALLLIIQRMIQKKLERGTANIIHVIAIIIALTGLYFTYNDFRDTISHRILGERFHLGGYLFWIGWIIISVFFLTRPADKRLRDDMAIE